MSDEIPQWARERAAELANKESDDACFTAAYVAAAYLGEAFARYIAQHEEPPVDPLLIEAREIVAKFYEGNGGPISSENFRAGKLDTTPLARVTLEGLRRGIELGKAGAA